MDDFRTTYIGRRWACPFALNGLKVEVFKGTLVSYDHLGLKWWIVKKFDRKIGRSLCFTSYQMGQDQKLNVADLEK